MKENENCNVKVSIIIPTYKREETLERAIESVLAQSLTNFQLIVVDDNNPLDKSRIRTEKIMEKYKSVSNVLYLKHEKNKNGSAARNTGLKNAIGEYISFLDDDDEYEPERLELLSKYMDSIGNDWGACYSGYKKFMADGTVQLSKESSTGNLLTQALMRSLYIGSGSNLFFRKEVINKIGFFDENFERNQDLEYLVRVLKEYKMAFVNSELLKIHYDVRTVNFSYSKSIDRELRFEKNFSSFIKELSPSDQRKVQIMYALDRMRLSLAYRKYIKAIVFLISNKVPFNIIVKYLIYGLDRKRNRVCYGFVF